MHRDRKSTRLNSSHTEIYTLSLHDALPISFHQKHEFPASMVLALLQPGRRFVETAHMHLLEQLGKFARNPDAAITSEYGSDTGYAFDDAMRSLVECIEIGRAHV